MNLPTDSGRPQMVKTKRSSWASPIGCRRCDARGKKSRQGLRYGPEMSRGHATILQRIVTWMP